MKQLLFIIFAFVCAGHLHLHAQQQPTVYTADNGDGTFKNPFLWGDWPDPDVIRVGDYFYFVSTSMHYVPGSPILRSKDLVNWEMAGYAVARYDENPKFDMQGGTMYLNGSWANTIRHHNGKFYVGFCTPRGWGADSGYFSICVADDVKGPWKRTIFPDYMYDPGLFFDDDGRVYVVHGAGTLYLTELNADALSVKGPFNAEPIWKGRVPRPQGSTAHYPAYSMEGSHMYKINGYYYITNPAGGTEGWQMCLRSKSIKGPYESKVIYQDESSYPNNGLHQGGMVQLKNGDWWFIIMQDRGPIGRVPHLMPVTWEDGWPILGDHGKGYAAGKKPHVGKTYPIANPATSDEFNTRTLGLQWQWNHNPDNSKWSLGERKGHLRLKASYAADLKSARNTLTQRVQGPTSAGTVEMDVSQLKAGNVAGFGVFQFPYAYIAIRKNSEGNMLIMVNDGKVIDSIPRFPHTRIWIRAQVTHVGFLATFSYSTDGKHFLPFGDTLKMGLGLDWTANRFALLNYSETFAGEGGFADFNWFHFDGAQQASPKPAGKSRKQ
ncbi:glycoside hydrolase family 43 protein [Chitinophaga rhizosphaerae]|uniref:glycoside hydrolase family 43 protein n=1 Tax=Chitinophaga rhizosphaerae TaxID=1864947 RepID=UPI000F7FDDD7|nr:glycoside hydrolase 43 family protein [Chitinophaga rhizosphaerae]